MSRAYGLCSLRAAAASMLLALALAPAANAVIYKWVEDGDRVVYSNEPPLDPSKVRDLIRLEGIQASPVERRAGEAANDPERAAAGAAGQAVGPREPVTLLPRDPPGAPAEAEPTRRAIPRSTHSGAVQDPCLVSPDPRCYERNRERYHPYLGYSPQGPAAQPVGASGGTAGGAVRGGVQFEHVKRGAYAMPPGSPPPAPITKPARALK